MAKIGNFYNEAGAVFNDNSRTLNVQQNNIQAQDKVDEEDSFDEEDVVLINRSDNLSKIDLFRVIISLYQYGAFKTADGKKLTKKRVFKAFEKMLGDNFGNYENDISVGSNKKGEVTIFKELEAAFARSEDNKLNK